MVLVAVMLGVDRGWGDSNGWEACVQLEWASSASAAYVEAGLVNNNEDEDDGVMMK